MWLNERPTRAEPAAAAVESTIEELPDTLLVREAKLGSEHAYGELTHRYQDRIFTFVHGQVPSWEDALDLTQEVFVKAHRNLGRFREDSLFYTWLYRIAMNACIDYRRRRGRAPEPFSLESDVLTEAGYEPSDMRVHSDPERALENKELARYLRIYIQALPEVLRMAVILHDIEGLPQKEIASILKCPLGTVKSRIQRGRYELREKLAPFLMGQPDLGHSDAVS